MRNLIIIVISIIVLVGGYFMFSKKPAMDGANTQVNEMSGNETGTMNTGQDKTTTGATTTTSTEVSAGTTTGTPTTVTIDVAGGNYYFKPGTITVHKGDTVKINFKNDGGMHDFKIDEFGVATKKIGSGQSDTVSFVADKAGSFEYYCSIGSHRQMGMKGMLIVE